MVGCDSATRGMFDLSGQRAIVVGGAGDLGSSITEALAEAGARVMVIDIDPRIAELERRLSSEGLDIFVEVTDISDREAIKTSFNRSIEQLGGRLDILVNSAGIQRRHPSESFPEDDWDQVIEVNLTAMFLYCQLAGNRMLEQGRGKIINVASMQSFFGGVTIPAYAASKGGVAQLTKALSNDWAGRGINVNAIAPGYMDTRLNTALVNDPQRNAETLARIPIRRWGVGSDMKGVSVFLASAASDYITGAVIPVDGGYLGR